MMLPTGGHMTEEQIEGYAAGSLSDENAGRIEEHLLVCESCRGAVEETAEFVSAIRKASGQLRREQARARRMRSIWAGIAAAALLLTAGVLLNTSKTGPAALGVVVRLETMRGALSVQAPAGKPLELRPDTTGLPAPPPYGLEVVTASGQRVWSGAAGLQAPPLGPGAYFVRVYSKSGSLLREYGLHVEPFLR